MENKEKPYLSEVIDYERDIDPYGFIQIYAGVGSGKNYFINELIKGYTGIRADGSTYTVAPKSVLLITSRRAKVDELLNEKDMSLGSYVLEWENGCPMDNIDEYFDSVRKLPVLDSWGNAEIHQRSIACTNAAIEKFLQKHHLPDDAATHLWQRFDFIVLDEAHSAKADATYQSAPFYTHKLVNKASKEYRNGNSKCKVIVMTGSPKILSTFRNAEHVHTLNFMDICKNVVPKQLSFVDYIEANKGMVRRLENGERVIYFANHIKTIFAIYDELSPQLQDKVAFSFSQPERLDINKPEQKLLYERMKDTEQEIAEKQEIPENIKLLLTTSKNKEGINIENKDITAMYTEAHAEVDIVQMAGRVRYGIDTLYVVTDSGGFSSGESYLEYDFTTNYLPITFYRPDKKGELQPYDINLLDYTNEFFEAVCKKNKIDLKDIWRKPTYSYKPLKECIDFIHAKFPYIKFNYFEDCFEMYGHRKSSLEYFSEQDKLFRDAVKSMDMPRLEALAKSWFKDIEVVWGDSRQAQIDKYLEDNGLIDVPYDDIRRSEVIVALSKIHGKPIKQFNKVLNKYGYKELKFSKNKASTTFGMRKIVKL